MLRRNRNGNSDADGAEAAAPGPKRRKGADVGQLVGKLLEEPAGRGSPSQWEQEAAEEFRRATASSGRLAEQEVIDLRRVEHAQDDDLASRPPPDPEIERHRTIGTQMSSDHRRRMEEINARR
jgi:hypothetical protein